MAFAGPNITAYAVEATEFPDLARRYGVNGVPKTVVNEEVEILGNFLLHRRVGEREQQQGNDRALDGERHPPRLGVALVEAPDTLYRDGP